MPHHEDDDLQPSEVERQRQMKAKRSILDESVHPGRVQVEIVHDQMDLLQQLIHDWAEDKGWNQALDERSMGDWCALMHSEISEAYEDYREHRKLDEVYYEDSDGTKLSFEEIQVRVRNWEKAERFLASDETSPRPTFKPCGIPIEMADLVIRVLHLAAFSGYSLHHMIMLKMNYNETRPFRHGGKKV